MQGKFFLYILVTIIVIWAMDSVNINQIFKKSSDQTTLDITFDPIVSSDIIGSTLGALVDGLSTEVLKTDEGELVKIVTWYDNELGYTSQMIRTMKYYLNLK